MGFFTKRKPVDYGIERANFHGQDVRFKAAKFYSVYMIFLLLIIVSFFGLHSSTFWFFIVKPSLILWGIWRLYCLFCPGNIKLDASGFEKNTFGIKRRHEWKDCSPFKAQAISPSKMFILWGNADGRPGPHVWMRLMFHNDTDMSLSDLRDTMNLYREYALRQAKSS